MAEIKTRPESLHSARHDEPGSGHAAEPVAQRSILWFGERARAGDWLERFAARHAQARIVSSSDFSPPTDLHDVDLVLFDPCAEELRQPVRLREFIRSLRAYPMVAVTQRDREHRGVAAQRMGAQGYLCIDGHDEAAQEDILEHARRRHRLLARLSEADGASLSILHSINDGVIVVDRRGRILDINPAARSMLGLPRRQMPPRGWESGFCALDADGATRLPEALRPLARAARGEKFANAVATCRGGDSGRDLVLSVNGQGLRDSTGSLAGGVITFRDVTDLTRRTAELEKRAQFDELTRLPNRSMFMRELERAIGRSQRAGKALAVLFLDLDRFKSVNDTLGHDVGDCLLREVGERLLRNLRIGDFSGRWGGDEFVVCLEDCRGASNAAAAAQKLILVLSERYSIMQSEVFVTPSIGIAMYPDSGGSAEQLVKAADLAMYQAKKRAGGRFYFYSEALNSELARREELELGLRHALVRNEFVLHYQPRIDVRSGRLIGFEALLRWQHPRYGLLPPARFLPILESSGLIHSAGEWVIDTACRELASWQRRYELPDLAVAINLSPQQLVKGRLPEFLSRTLADTSLDPGCVELEVNDTDLVRARSAQSLTLEKLRALGLRLSLDRFGTRDVSLRSLDSGVIDGFVLDPSLIEDVAVNGSHQRIVRAAIAMARGLDIEVAAEGVETSLQLEFLKNCDCDLAQGYLISRPMHADKVHAVLQGEVAGSRLWSAALGIA